MPKKSLFTVTIVTNNGDKLHDLNPWTEEMINSLNDGLSKGGEGLLRVQLASQGGGTVSQGLANPIVMIPLRSISYVRAIPKIEV